MSAGSHAIGNWSGDENSLVSDERAVARALERTFEPLYVVMKDGQAMMSSAGAPASEGSPLIAIAPAARPSSLGDPRFSQRHQLRLNYVAGAMAGGIASVELVQAMARAGLLAFYGAAGLDKETVAKSIDLLNETLVGRTWGSNLIHSPYEKKLEEDIVDLYLEKGVRLVSASAYLDLTLPLLRYRYSGIHVDGSGEIVCPNDVIGKVSRREVAEKFMRPPSAAWLDKLKGVLTDDEIALASEVPVVSALTVEADSGGHTDNRQASALLPVMIALRDRVCAETGQHIFIGAAGGIGDPRAAAAAFSMGADYVVTGTINQACVESGTSDAVRALLKSAEQTDVTMAPAADMFEMGVELQVLRRGTLFAGRAHKLYALYTSRQSLAELTPDERRELEEKIFRLPLDEVREQTRAFWRSRDPAELSRMDDDAHREMAMVFRWYLGQSSRWANRGQSDRAADFQVWCGPAIGAFNTWCEGSFLDEVSARRVVPVALNIMHGAAVLIRAQSLRAQGVNITPAQLDLVPRPLSHLEELHV